MKKEAGSWKSEVRTTIKLTTRYFYFANKYTKVVTGLPVKDATGGYKCFRRKVLESKKKEIDMSSYPAGIYIYHVGEARGKLVKE